MSSAYRRYAAGYPLPLPKEEQMELARLRDWARARSDKCTEEAAITTLTTHSQRLAVKLAFTKYAYLQDKDALVMIGTLGIWRAARTWDPQKGSFGTYSWRYIQNAVHREYVLAETEGPVRYPIYVVDRRNMITSLNGRHYRLCGKGLPTSELADKLGITPEQILQAKRRPKYLPLRDDLLMIYQLTKRFESTRAGELDDHLKQGYEPPDLTETPEDKVLREELTKVCAEAVAGLDPREAYAVKQYFAKDWSLEKIAETFLLTRERVRQILIKSLRLLRHPARRGKMLEFVTP